MPKIATANGTGYRADVVENHLTSDYHIACVNAERASQLTIPNKVQTPMDVAISTANLKQANYIGKLMIQIYTDAKSLTLAAWNWPARYVTNEASNAFQYNKPEENTIPKNLSLQYVNPNKHLELMHGIVDADRANLKSKIADCLALSLRIDGSVDKAQIDKIYVLGKIITKTGKTELVFLGMDEQTARKAIGLFQASINAMANLFSKEFVYQNILPKMSSICTDGVNTNRGDKGGLWHYFEEEIAKTNSTIPLVKIWCAAHRANLTFNDLTSNNPTLYDIISVMSKISSHFHTSGMRTRELKEIAKEIGLKLLAMPKHFEIRWTEFLFKLFKAILTNWNALILHFDRYPDAQSRGFKIFLTNIQKLKLITFFADFLFVYQRFHKQMQLEFLTLPKFHQCVKNVSGALADLKSRPLPGGIESALSNQMEEIEIQPEDLSQEKQKKIYLKGIELFEPEVRRHQPLSFESLRGNIIDSMAEYLKIRLEDQNEDLLLAIEEFLKFDKATDIKIIHRLIGADLDLASLHLQYTDLSNSSSDIKCLPLLQLLKYLTEPTRVDFFSEIITVIARIAACTPNSADVERVISANNNLKTKKRMSLLVETENGYLYIHFNMPPLEKWNPRSAVSKYLSELNRRQSHQTVETTKTTKQPYFKHIFEDASDEEDDDSVEQLKSFSF